MEVFKILEPYFEQLRRPVMRVRHCIDNDVGLPVCHDFWLWVMIAAFGFALLIVALIIKRVLREQFEFYRNEKRLAARAIVASQKEMEAVRAKDDALDDEREAVPADDLADQFRRALREQRTGPAPH
jgi:hypothetical protein